MQLAYQTLHHNRLAGDMGLPRQYLSSLRPRVWQTILVWIEKNLEQINTLGINPTDRLNMIRYAVLDSLNFLIPWQSNISGYVAQDWFSSFPLELAVNQSHFPGLELYRQIHNRVIGNNFPCTFHNPDSYSKWLSSGISRAGLTINELSSEHFLIMYAQREYLVKWETYRMDVDHILPSAWMNFKAGPIAANHFWKVENIEYWMRNRVLNWSGNKRFWPDSLNRIYRDATPQGKFIGSNLDLPVDDPHHLHRFYGLYTVKDILEASAIDEDLAEKWATLSIPDTREQRIWTTQRFLDFAQTVNQRRCRMYQQLYETLQLSEWEDSLSVHPQEK
jgi:hypothetical protein